MLFDDQYFMIESSVQGSFKDRGSRFIGIAIPVLTEQEVKRELEVLKKQYFDATHHCYAYILGADKSAWRVNDDGEPSGTAGRPIHGQILSANLTNILVVVIRYYGGTKLGVPGLINAYKSAAREAIGNATIITCIVKEVYQLDYDYILMNEVMKIVKEEGVEVLKTEFGMKCVMQIAIRKQHADKVCTRFHRLSSLKTNYLRTT
ncbi:MAG: YigZ family protein [Bacteroidales bacterium]|nr:YigZ family protein [Bacteroidales bacterium]